jgi:hypothetical protein
VTVFKNTPWLWLSLTLVLVPIFALCSLKAGAAAATMDYMPPQFPTLPAESSDIFSLSDQVLSDRLEFIEEAGLSPLEIKRIV